MAKVKKEQNLGAIWPLTASKAIYVICANFGSSLPQAQTDKKGVTILSFQQTIIIQQVHSNYNSEYNKSDY